MGSPNSSRLTSIKKATRMSLNLYTFSANMETIPAPSPYSPNNS